MQQNQPCCGLSGCFSTILFLLVSKSIDSIKEKTEKNIEETPFLKKEKPIPDMLKFKANHNKRK